MSSSEFTEADIWGGRPVARKISDAVSRSRVVVSGVVDRTCATDFHGTTCYRCTLHDGTGQIVLLFLGRRQVAGIVVGSRCTVEGTAISEGGNLVVWNPLYRIETS